jgi:hypothetical protein
LQQFVIGKYTIGNNLKYPDTRQYVNKRWHIHTVEYYAAMKKELELFYEQIRNESQLIIK